MICKVEKVVSFESGISRLYYTAADWEFQTAVVNDIQINRPALFMFYAFSLSFCKQQDLNYQEPGPEPSAPFGDSPL